MKNQAHIWKEEKTEADGSITIAAIIEDSKQSKTSVWYRVPAEHSSKITKSWDPLVVGTIFWGMKKGADLHFHGEVSPSLLRNLEKLQIIWSCWAPKSFKTIDVIADQEIEQQGADDSAGDIMAFSGGVDACFTAFRHATNRCGRLNRNLKAGLMIHGVEIPLKQKEVFERAYKNSEAILDSLGVELITMATNFKALSLGPDAFAGMAGSCLMLFQGTYKAGLISSSEPYQALVTPWGTHPLTDPLVSSDAFEIIHDSADFTRTQKIAMLGNWPEALSRLRVCWYGPQNQSNFEGLNCGRCEKCVRTILNLRVVGLPLPESFDQDISDAHISSLRHLDPTQTNEFQQILIEAEKAGISDSWVNALKLCLWRNRLEAKLRTLWYPIKNTIYNLLPGLKKQKQKTSIWKP
ncbi:MAG: hypothetical protein WBA93_35725 [Microcoleaceae cyanobacterium]